MKKSVIIVGGGISGLSAAYYLSKADQDIEITLLESKPKLGGVIETFSRSGFLMEGGPDAFISEKPAALELIKELGIEKSVIGTNPDFRRSFIYKKGKLIQVPEGLYLMAPSQVGTFALSPLLSWKTKLRMALEIFIPPKKDTDDESVASFVRRRLGRGALERIAQPMIGGIYTADPENLSLKTTMPQFLEMEKKYGSVIKALVARRRSRQKNTAQSISGPRYSLFLSLKDGLGSFIKTLEKELNQVNFKFSSSVSSLKQNREWEVGLDSGESLRADAIILAVSAPQASKILSSVSPNINRDLNQIPYESVATVNMVFNRKDIPYPLNGFGFVVPTADKRKLVACSFSSIKYTGRAPENKVLLRAFVGGALHREMYELSDSDMAVMVRSELEHYLGVKKEPLFSLISRYPEAMPQYHVGHLELVDRIQSQLQNFPGLFLAGNAYSGIGLPDCVKRAKAQTDAALKFFKIPQKELSLV